MDHPICEQGDSDAHQLLQAASQSMGRPRKSTGERRSKKTLTALQFELGWDRYDRVRHALEDLDEDAAGRIWAADNVLFVQDGLECRCQTSVPSSMLDISSSGGSSRAPARPRARGGPRPPSPSSPSSLPSAADSGRRSSPGRAATPEARRSGEGSDDHGQDETPSVIAGRRVGRRRRGDPEDALGDPARRERQRNLKRRATPVEDWNANQLADEFIDIAKRTFNSFGQHRNPRMPLAKFFAEARRKGVPNATLLAVVKEYLRNYRLDGPPWRPFISAAPEMVKARQSREKKFGSTLGEERVTQAELDARYGLAPGPQAGSAGTTSEHTDG